MGSWQDKGVHRPDWRPRPDAELHVVAAALRDGDVSAQCRPGGQPFLQLGVQGASADRVRDVRAIVDGHCGSYRLSAQPVRWAASASIAGRRRDGIAASVRRFWTQAGLPSLPLAGRKVGRSPPTYVEFLTVADRPI